MDLNGDGHNDILSGSYSRMESEMAGLFQVLYGQEDGNFKKAEVLNGTDGQPLIIPIAGREQQTENICTRPSAVDWDGDGDLDLVVGNFSGTFYLFPGEGEGKFSPKPEPILSSGEPLRINGAHSDPFIVDWDGDGDYDLLSGSSQGGVYWAENEGVAGKTPALKPFQVLIEPNSVTYGQQLKEEDLTGPTSATRIWVDDMNSDGKLDIFVGDRVTLVSAAGGLSDDEFKEKLEAWQQDAQKAIELLNDPNLSDEKRIEASNRYRELYDQRGKFMTEEMTGFVWVYLQK